MTFVGEFFYRRNRKTESYNVVEIKSVLYPSMGRDSVKSLAFLWLLPVNIA